MATITGFTAARMLEIEDGTVVDAEIRDGDLWLIRHDGSEINAGSVEGPQGPVGPMGPASISAIPGEVRLWSGSALPALGTYGRWVWADGAVYPVASHPLAAGHIATQWRTFAGASDPGAPNFRVPDMRGLAPVGMDAMPGGARANRMTRSVAITIASKAGEETHIITVPEMPAHAHGVTDPGHTHLGSSGDRQSGGYQTFGQALTYNAYETFNAPYISTNPTGISIQNAGGNGAHENVQPSVFVPYIVYLDG